MWPLRQRLILAITDAVSISLKEPQEEAEPLSRDELVDAIAVLEADYSAGEFSGGGYRYVEATPEALRKLLDVVAARRVTEHPEGGE